VTDSKLRELERRWKESGSVEDEARYLLGRVRVGNLERGKLELAAYCGHEGALMSVPQLKGARSLPLRDWLRRLRSRFGREALVRAGLVFAWNCLPTWERVAPSDRRPRMAIDAAEEWLRSPGQETEAHAAEMAERASDAFHEACNAVFAPDDDQLDSEWVVTDEMRELRSVAWVASVAADPAHSIRARSSSRVTAGVARAIRTGTHTETAIRASIERHLVAWALGDGPESLETARRAGLPKSRREVADGGSRTRQSHGPERSEGPSHGHP